MEASQQQQDPPAAPERREGEQLYVVQASPPMTGELLEALDGERVWIDVATVTVPPRTKRRTIIERALEQAPKHKPESKPGVGKTPFRVLDADSAAPVDVWWEHPPAPAPELRIG